jgi:hypothetical protein
MDKTRKGVSDCLIARDPRGEEQVDAVTDMRLQTTNYEPQNGEPEPGA